MNYFSRVTMNTDHVNAQKLAKVMCADAYREHQSLWRLFDTDPDADRDFLFRREAVSNALRYFLVSERPPQDSAGLWKIEHKHYEPKLSVGQKLAFTLRVNPVVTRKDKGGKGKRHDVVMDAKIRMDYKNLPDSKRQPMTKIVQDAGLAWLKPRAEKNGFRIHEALALVDAYQQHRSYKNGRKTPICYSTLDFSGVLEVIDTTQFNSALTSGIGPAKAFGCGLLLVRRI